MPGQALRESIESVVQPIADGQPGGVGRQSQDVEAGASGQVELRVLDGATRGQGFQLGPDAGGLARVVRWLHHVGEEVFGLLRLLLAGDGGSVGPEHQAGVAHRPGQAVAATAVQHPVERSAVAEGGGLAGRRVVALRLAVRSESVEVE